MAEGGGYHPTTVILLRLYGHDDSLPEGAEHLPCFQLGLFLLFVGSTLLAFLACRQPAPQPVIVQAEPVVAEKV